MGDVRSVYKILVRIPERKVFGDSRCISDNNIKTDVKEMGCERVGWIYRAQDGIYW